MDSAVLMDFVFDDDEMLELQPILIGVVILGAEQVRVQKKIRTPDPSRAASNSSQIMSLHHRLSFARAMMTVLSSPQWDLM
jgi:hypothetical protein